MARIRHIESKQDWRGERINGVAHPRNIADLWSDAELSAIGLERYEPPVVEPKPVDPLTLPLNRVQFKAMLKIAGVEQKVRQAVAGIADPVQQAVAEAKLEESDSYDRDNPLFALLAPAVGLTSAEIDALWVQAQEIA